MKNIIQLCMVMGVLMCTATALHAQGSPLTMKILETNSTDDQFCFYVHANTSQQANTISVLADTNTEDNNTEGIIMTECFDDDVCRTKICYDRPTTEPVETLIECKASGSTFSVSDGCTVLIFPRNYRAQEPVELNIIADCGFGTPCNTANLNPNDISHLTLGVPRDDGGFDYIAYAGLYGTVEWFNEDRELIHSGAWTSKVDEVAYVEFNHYQSVQPILSGFGNTLGDAGLSFRYSTYPNTEEAAKSINLTNYPNPFRGQTTIQFDLPEDAPVTLTLYDMMGKTVTKVLNQETKARGEHEVVFDSSELFSGIYYYTVQAGEYTGTGKMNIMK